MPLSPKHLLFTQIGDDIPRRFVLTTAQTSEFQRFIAERAHRMIFARKPMSCVEQLRPRLVNLELYRHEQVAWGNWHDDQRRVEQDLEDGN